MLSDPQHRTPPRLPCRRPFIAGPAAILLGLMAGCVGSPEDDAPTRHMIAAANPHAARAGLEILRAGGSAVDATIAAQMVLTLVEPQSSGIGGGAFLLHYAPPSGQEGAKPTLNAYDGREAAPAGVTERHYLGPDGKPMDYRRRAVGGHSVAVPGLLRMAELAHQAHGKLPWARLFAPAIRLAERGFAVSPRLNRMITRNRQLPLFPAARRYFFTKGGKPLPVGALLRNPDLADTLRRVAAGGAGAFYQGPIAADIAAAVRDGTRYPGIMTTADIAAYRAKARRVLCRPYRAWRVCTMPPPTSGGIAILQILGLLERFELSRLAPGSVQAAHLIAEASRLAFADRNLYVADPDFIDVPVAGLLDAHYLATRAELISAGVSMGRAVAGDPARKPHAQAPDSAEDRAVSTSHLSVVDGDGNAVAMTTSIGNAFGARLLVRGFMLNDHMSDFSARPRRGGRAVVNRVQPGKRPRSSMSPTIVTDRDGRFVLSVGSPGGRNIIGYVTKALIGALDWDLSMQQAVDLPNIVNRNGPTLVERGAVAADVADALSALGHEVKPRGLTSGLHGIRRRARVLDGGADARREGMALGE
ncbi:MAG: gamma-glutamyltransferase [Alphaproteobacteria bacterium]